MVFTQLRLYQIRPGESAYRMMAQFPDGRIVDQTVQVPEPESVGAVTLQVGGFSVTIEANPSENPPDKDSE